MAKKKVAGVIRIPALNAPFLVNQLLDAGLTQQSIAEHIGVRQPTISGIANSQQTEMLWVHGERLRELHKRIKRRT